MQLPLVSGECMDFAARPDVPDDDPVLDHPREEAAVGVESGRAVRRRLPGEVERILPAGRIPQLHLPRLPGFRTAAGQMNAVRVNAEGADGMRVPLEGA